MAMTFAGLYELGDVLLVTTVETLQATKLNDQSKVYVHVFSASANQIEANAPAELVTQRFAELTGSSPVRVLDAAVDEATGYAYVVTEPLSIETMTAWTKGSCSSAPTALGAETLSNLQRARASRTSAVGMPSQNIARLGSDEAKRSEAPYERASVPSAKPADSEPGAFTKMFGDYSHQEPSHDQPRAEAAKIVAIDARSLEPEAERKVDPHSFTSMFGASSPKPAESLKENTAGTYSWSSTPPAPKMKSEDGLQAAPRRGVGEFTKQFGMEREEKPIADRVAPAQAPVAESMMKPEPEVSAQAVAPSLPVKEARPDVRYEEPSSHSGDRADHSTQFFGSRSPQVSEPVLPAGPSEYTKVFSGFQARGPQPGMATSPKASNAVVDASVAAASVAVNPGPMPTFTPPYIPAVQAPTIQPAQVVAPSVRVVPAPAAVPLPQVPKARVNTTLPARPSWLPLILILNGLFVLAVVIVLLFVLLGR